MKELVIRWLRAQDDVPSAQLGATTESMLSESPLQFSSTGRKQSSHYHHGQKIDMNLNEINSYVELGAHRSICIDCILIADFPGMVREITICPKCLVKISYNAHGTDEGGLEFHLSYASQSELVSSLEDFLQSPLAKWKNFTKTGEYPDAPPATADGQNHRLLVEALKTNNVDLPKGWMSSSVHPSYWRDLVNIK
jgi:hypothetical protein